MNPTSRKREISVLAVVILLAFLSLCLMACAGPIIAKQKVREGFEYLNQRDTKKFVDLWDDNARFTYPGTVKASGTIQGKAAIQNWFQHLMDEGPFVHFTIINICVESITDLRGSNVIAVEWENTGKSRNGDGFAIRGISMITTKNMKIAQVRDYIFDTEKLPAIWNEVQ